MHEHISWLAEKPHLKLLRLHSKMQKPIFPTQEIAISGR